MDLSQHRHTRRDGYALLDARGIFCTYVCEECESEKRKQFRCEIFEDPNYETCEDIEEDY